MKVGLGFMLALATLANCGDGLEDNNYKGAPVLNLRGVTLGSLGINQTVTEVRAALVWFQFESEFVKCLEQAYPDGDLSQCRDSFQRGVIAADVELNSSFPTAFEIPLFELPDASQLSVGNFGSHGQAALYVYDDVNQNGQLDLFAGEATSDVVLGASWNNPFFGGPGNVDYRVMYREGNVDAMTHFMYPLCDIPEGFSIAKITTTSNYYPEVDWFEEVCEVLPAEEQIPTSLSDKPSTQDLICFFDDTLWQRYGSAVLAPQAAPAIDHFECGVFGYTLFAYATPGVPVCMDDQFVRYMLDWSADVPAWWPCEISEM